MIRRVDIGLPEVDRRTTEGSRDAIFLSLLIPGPASLVEVFSLPDTLPDTLPDALSRLDFPEADSNVADDLT